MFTTVSLMDDFWHDVQKFHNFRQGAKNGPKSGIPSGAAKRFRGRFEDVSPFLPQKTEHESTSICKIVDSQR